VKVRSAEELSDLLGENLKRRKRELTTFRFLVERMRGNADHPVVLRASVPLLYSHWEGFVKYATNAYIAFVDHQGLTYKFLAPSLVGLALRSAFLEAQQSPYSHGARTRVMRTLIERSWEHARLPIASSVKTSNEEAAVSTSNLNSTVFFDLLDLLDIDTTSYEPKQVLIDEKLLKRRNLIAHGELLAVFDDDHKELHGEVLGLIEAFNVDVVNAAVLRKYMRNGHDSSYPLPSPPQEEGRVPDIDWSL
jgi:hypothetical protein